MYTLERLSKYDYFRDKLKENGLSHILDSLTGTVTRPMIIGFVREMIDKKVPFTAAIIDLDNFKSINDNYGHDQGDVVLKKVSDDLMNYIGDSGLLGRIGGDEFLMINFDYLTYDDIHEFYEGMCINDTVFRKALQLNGGKAYISSTIGSAAFPTDADNYDMLFALMDKTLYRGKSKGRNCYIIYVEHKHKHLTVQKLAKHSIFHTMRNLANAFDCGRNLKNKLNRVNQPLCAELHILDCYYIDKEGDMVQFSDYKNVGKADDIGNIMEDVCYHTDDFTDIEKLCPNTYKIIKELEFETILVVNIEYKNEKCGYILCPGEYIRRLWQEEEQALAFFVGRMIAEYLERKKEK